MPGDIKVTMTASQLNGSQRVLLDGVTSEDECRELQRLSNVSDGRKEGREEGRKQHVASKTDSLMQRCLIIMPNNST